MQLKHPMMLKTAPTAKTFWPKMSINSADLGLPGGSVAKTPCSQCRGPGLIPGQGIRSHRLQPRVPMPQGTSKIPHAGK